MPKKKTEKTEKKEQGRKTALMGRFEHLLEKAGATELLVDSVEKRVKKAHMTKALDVIYAELETEQACKDVLFYFMAVPDNKLAPDLIEFEQDSDSKSGYRMIYYKRPFE